MIFTLHNLIITLESAVFIYLSYLAGSFFLRRLGLNLTASIKRIAYSIIAGYGLFALVGMVLAIFGFFDQLWLWGFALLVILISIREIKGHFQIITKGLPFVSKGQPFGAWFKEYPILKVIIVLWVFANFLIVFVPLTGHDTLDYHLPIMRDIIQEGRYTFSETVNPSYTYLPVLGETFYAVSMELFANFTDPFVFQILQYSTIVLFLLLIYDFLRPHLRSELWALVAVLGVMAIFDFQRELLHGGYVDVFTYLFGLTSFFLIVSIASAKTPDVETPDVEVPKHRVFGVSHSELLLSGFFLGLALGVKYLAGVFALINLLVLFLGFWRQKAGFRLVLNNLVPYFGVAALVAGFWYLKNLVVFANPVHPMFTSSQFSQDVGMFLLDRNFLNFLIFPFVRYGQWFVQAVETSSRLVVLGYFVLLYPLIVLLLFLRRRLSSLELTLFAFIEIYLLALFLFSHQYRFLLPAVIVLPALLALLADGLYDLIRERRQRIYRPFLKLTLVGLNLIFLAAFLYGNFHYFYVKYFYLVGYYDKAEYILEIGGQ